MATKQKYRELIEYLPAEYRQNYSMAMSEVTEELAGQFEKFGLDPYFAPLMADSLAGWSYDIFFAKVYFRSIFLSILNGFTRCLLTSNFITPNCVLLYIM